MINIELPSPKFKVGDRVKYTSHMGSKYDLKGEVTNISAGPIYIKADKNGKNRIFKGWTYKLDSSDGFCQETSLSLFSPEDSLIESVKKYGINIDSKEFCVNKIEKDYYTDTITIKGFVRGAGLKREDC